MLLHHRPLVRRQLAWLKQDRIRDGDFTDVVQGRRKEQLFGERIVEAQRSRQHTAVAGDTRNVVAGLLIAELGDLAQPPDDGDAGGGQFAGSFLNATLEYFILRLEFVLKRLEP